MAFSSAVLGNVPIGGGKRKAWGTWASGSTTGGDINTGLTVVENIQISPIKTSVATNACVVNETTWPMVGKPTIVTDSGVDGLWEAVGV
jgi:hypothetical protein